MGIESFQVELRGVSCPSSQIVNTILRLPNIHRDDDSIPLPETQHLTWEDGSHVIEIEVSHSVHRISCRFTLSHPTTIDEVFLRLVCDLQSRYVQDARICDNVISEHAGWYSLAQYDEFTEIARHYIAIRREEWIAHFGDTLLAAKSCDVYAHLILPHCQPVSV